MTRLMALLLGGALLAACAAEPPPTPEPTFDESPFQQLDQSLRGLTEARPGVPSVEAVASSRRGAVLGTAYRVELGHCGLGSPLDFDGSLWDPVAGHDGRGRPLSEEQVIELINASTVELVLVDVDAAVLITPGRGMVLLRRHVGPRRYNLCD